jgi:hypothetical protein
LNYKTPHVPALELNREGYFKADHQVKSKQGGGENGKTLSLVGVGVCSFFAERLFCNNGFG